jgi:ribosome-binding protein aMBF1 (putative translation factor)
MINELKKPGATRKGIAKNRLLDVAIVLGENSILKKKLNEFSNEFEKLIEIVDVLITPYETAKEFGAYLKAMRQASGLTQKELSIVLNCDRSLIGYIERGEVSACRMEQMKKDLLNLKKEGKI